MKSVFTWTIGKGLEIFLDDIENASGIVDQRLFKLQALVKIQ
jgi:hypothetical protein